MPVNEKADSEIIYQREQYQKGGIGRLYWDYRDAVALNFLDDEDHQVLDIGCGEGITLEKTAHKFPNSEVRGIDFMDENIVICRQHGLNAEKGDVYNLHGISDSSLDAVMFMEVIEHLEKPETAIDEVFRILKPGGKIVVVFPNDAIFKVSRLMTFKFKEAFYDPGHVHQWTLFEMKRFLSKHGFKVCKMKAIPFYYWGLSLHGVIYARKGDLAK